MLPVTICNQSTLTMKCTLYKPALALVTKEEEFITLCFLQKHSFFNMSPWRLQHLSYCVPVLLYIHSGEKSCHLYINPGIHCLKAPHLYGSAVLSATSSSLVKDRNHSGRNLVVCSLDCSWQSSQTITIGVSIYCCP